MITTMTHDTKRSEDVRARLNVLSEIPDEWRECLNRWSRINKSKKSNLEGQWAPDRNEEYLLYQTLLGVWPNHPLNEREAEVFGKRIRDYMLKATREAKVHTSWISPNIPYEEGLFKFIDAVLSSHLFMDDFQVLQKKVAYFGMFNSLGQTLLKMTSPGNPDFYQGTEIWDFSLVDPDNRRPVNFELRKERLAALKKRIEPAGPNLLECVRDLLREWKEGTIKLYLIYKALNYRRENPHLFTESHYIPLAGEGDKTEHLCAFVRQREDQIALIVIPRFLTSLIKGIDEAPLGAEVWGESRLVLPEEIVGNHFRDLFTGETIERVERSGTGGLPLAKVFAHFPVAMLEKA